MIVDSDKFEGDLILYGLDSRTVKIPCTFVKHIRPNPIYPPYYAPEDADAVLNKYRKMGYKIVGPMYDGRSRYSYDIHDRYETEELYDALSR